MRAKDLFEPYLQAGPYAPDWSRHVAVVRFEHAAQKNPPGLHDVIKLGKNATVPALVLTDAAREALVEALVPSGRRVTRQNLRVKLYRTLGTLPHFWWAKSLLFTQTPHGIKVVYQDRGEPTKELKEMRTCILRS